MKLQQKQSLFKKSNEQNSHHWNIIISGAQLLHLLVESIIRLSYTLDKVRGEHSWIEAVVRRHVLVVLRWVPGTRWLFLPVVASVSVVLLAHIIVLRTGILVVVVLVARSGLSIILVLIVPVVLVLSSLGRRPGVGSSPSPGSAPRATSVVLITSMRVLDNSQIANSI